MRAGLTILICLFSFNVCLRASEPRQQVEAFLDAVVAGNIDAAYDGLFKGSYMLQSKPEQVEYLKSQSKAALPLYGARIGYDLVADAPFGTSVRMLVYILKAEKHPLVWVFYYHCPKDVWFLSNLSFNDEFKGL